MFGSSALETAVYEAPNPSKKDVVAYVTGRAFAAARAARARDIAITTHVHAHIVARDDHRPLARVVIVVAVVGVIMFGDARFHSRGLNTEHGRN